MVARRQPSRDLTITSQPFEYRDTPKLRNGNQIGPGRQPGSKNKVPMMLRDAILVAARELGADGKGKDGLVGYLKKIARKNPVAYITLLRAVLPLTVRAEVNIDETVTYRSSQEVREELQRRGVPIDGVFTVIQGGKQTPATVHVSDDEQQEIQG